MHVQSPSLKGRATLLVLLMLCAPLLTAASAQSQSKSTTVWSGVVEIDDYTVGNGQVLQITAGTTVRISDGSRLYVEGRLAVEGTASDPVTLEVDGSGGDHDGIQFNSTSHGFGSSIDNLTITESVYGITIYGSDPRISNLTILNADRVGIDLFDYASPVITDLVIDGGGQDLHGTSLSYRYGFGVSIGYQSTVVLTNASITNLLTRGLNFWGSSGGIVSGIVVENVSGATLAAAAGVWVEDSIPLLEDIAVKTSDTGIFVRHISEEMTTRPTFVRTTIEDSMYRGVSVDRYYDKSDISNLHNSQAVFEDLVIRGTGGPGAKTPGLGMHAIDVNTSSVRLTGQNLIEDNPVPSRFYMIDSSTKITNLTLNNNGNPSTLAQPWERASLAIRSASWTSSGPPQVIGLEIVNSSGVGVHLTKGGVTGSDWQISGSGGTGLFAKEFHPDLSGVISTGNGGHGVSVIDSGNVELSFVSTAGNDGAGIWFKESNYVESSGKNVTCFSCTSDGDQVGYLVEDSIDLQLLHTEVRDPTSGIGLGVNNSGLSQSGHVVISDMKIASNSSTFAIELEETDAKISLLDLNGDNLGMSWSAEGSLTSYLNDSVIQSGSSTGCLELREHTELLATNVGFACMARPSVSSSFVNFTDSWFVSGANLTDSFSMLGDSWIRWISSSSIGAPTSNGSNNILDLSHFLKVFAINQNLLNIPMAQADISFDMYEDNYSTTLPFSGFETLGPFVGLRWLPSGGWGQQNHANVSCTYDGETNHTSPIAIDDDKRAYCRLELSPQPPFLVWDLPKDGLEVSSGSEVEFSANNSFDLDLDALTYSWTSSIDGDLSSCATNGSGNGSYFVANIGEVCLSDGAHQITATLCDEAGNCVNETRTITLVNRPPVLSVQVVEPQVEAWGILYLGQTASVTISLEGTYDVEGPLWCWVEAEFESVDIDMNNPSCPMEIVRNFIGSPQDSFEVKIFAYDGLNTVYWAFDIVLYNELPNPVWEIQRNGQTSADWISLDGSATVDPEGDPVKFEFHSSIDGLLASGSSPDPIGFTGTLSKGTHEITFYASDSLGEHAGQWNSISTQISVSNSAPHAIIASPQDGFSTDSSVLVNFDATGSGDWDVSCLELPDNGSGLLCNPLATSSTDIVSVLWQSDQFEEPLGSGWGVQSRLFAGTHVITLTIDDGSSQPVSDSISLEVSKSAPVLVLDSPIVAEVYSNLPVLFDFRNSFDADGDEFTVTVLSDLMAEPILDSVSCCEYWYNDYLGSGVHTLTFILTDSDGHERIHTQSITVLETGPVAVISGLLDGQYVPPGHEIALSASDSFDYDEDIVLYQWSLPSGEVLSDRQNLTLSFPPGPVRVNLMVQDSRGAESYASINITVGSSAPVLLDLTISVLEIEADQPTDVVTTVRLDDPDGTTDTVRGELASGGVTEALYFRDDGQGGDQVENDGIWTNRGTWLVSEGSWAKVEVYAIDGELVSPAIVQTIPIVRPSDGGLVEWLTNSGLPFLVISMLAMGLAGMAYQRRRSLEIIKDLAEIERWSSFVPTEMDLEFDEESGPTPPQDPKE